MKGLNELIYHARQKTAPFYFCNSFCKTSSVMTIFGTQTQSVNFLSPVYSIFFT